LRFTPLELTGCHLVELELIEDERGFFARSWSGEEFRAHGLNGQLVQCNVSFNVRRGTVRGLHFQAAPDEEVKLVRCTRGAIFDVAVDVRSGSPTCGRWVSAELSSENRQSLYIPEGFAHGFQSLVDGSEVFYQMSHHYVAEAARGIAWDDPEVAIAWPLGDAILSDRDRSLPTLARLSS
jgi:dTDP-4-dehydrorhamnose 3,5-epimerase